MGSFPIGLIATKAGAVDLLTKAAINGSFAQRLAADGFAAVAVAL